MEEKYTSIIIDGAYKAIFVLIYILLLMFLNLLPLEYITLKDILFLIVVLFIVPLFEGYLDYMLYSSKKLEK
jgi:hypothetical protein